MKDKLGHGSNGRGIGALKSDRNLGGMKSGSLAGHNPGSTKGKGSSHPNHPAHDIAALRSTARVNVRKAFGK